MRSNRYIFQEQQDRHLMFVLHETKAATLAENAERACSFENWGICYWRFNIPQLNRNGPLR
jgi:hypothetical protein